MTQVLLTIENEYIMEFKHMVTALVFVLVVFAKCFRAVPAVVAEKFFL